MKSLMVDIETLGTGSNAAVISVGICAFSEAGVIDSAGWAIAARDWHGDIDPETIKWWILQNPVAATFSFSGGDSDLSVMQYLSSFIAAHGSDEVWANDPDFDLVILRNWWGRCLRLSGIKSRKWPIPYKAARSYRTLTAEARRLGIQYNGWTAAATAHVPADDACAQARAIVQIRRNLIGATA